MWARRGVLEWPASAILTGNSTAFILRAVHTRHGDWWSLNGAGWLLFAALAGLLSKHLVRLEGRHLYNPSNLGIVLCLLLAGPFHVYPQYLWWGPLSSWPVLLSFAVIVAGAVWALRPLGMDPLIAGFAAVFTAGVAALALSGRCFLSAWSPEEVCGTSYWADICLSPELFVFVLFMISDPRTVPEGRQARLLFGGAVAAVAVALMAPQFTEYGVKLAILASLAAVCSAVPALRLLRRPAPRGRRRLLPAGVALAAALLISTSAALLGSAPAAVAADRYPVYPGEPGLQ